MASWALAELPVATVNINANEDQGSVRLERGFVMIISAMQWREVADQVLSCARCLRLWRSEARFLKWGHIKRCGHVLWSERGPPALIRHVGEWRFKQGKPERKPESWKAENALKRHLCIQCEWMGMCVNDCIYKVAKNKLLKFASNPGKSWWDAPFVHLHDLIFSLFAIFQNILKHGNIDGDDWSESA